MKNLMKIKNKDHIDPGLHMDTNIVVIKSVILSNTLATFEVQFMKNLSNTDAQFKKNVAHEKTAYNYLFS